MGPFAHPMSAWASIVSNYAGFPSFKSVTGGCRIQIGDVTGTGWQLRLDDPDDNEVRDAVELAASLGLDAVTRNRYNGVVIEVLA